MQAYRKIITVTLPCHCATGLLLGPSLVTFTLLPGPPLLTVTHPTLADPPT